MRAIVSNSGGFGLNLSVKVNFIDDTVSPEMVLGTVDIPVSIDGVTTVAQLRSALPSAISAWCIANGVDTPSTYFYDQDGQTVAQSSVTGLIAALASKVNSSSLATVATTGSYSDLTGKPTIPSTTRTTSALSLSLVGTGATGTQISATKDSSIRANVSTSTTSTIGGPGTSAVALKICSTNNATEASWTTVATLENDQTITLAIALNSIQVVKGQLVTDVPAGWYVKLVNTGSGTHSESFITGQQTIYG